MNKELNRLNFLHSHPIQERVLGIDDKHVMVDKADWEVVRRVVLSGSCRPYEGINEL